MWSPDRRRFLLLGAGAMALAGCGFRPALRQEDGAGIARLRDATRLDTPRGRLGFALRAALEERLGRPGPDADWRLTADLRMTESGLAVTPDSSITRYVVRGRSRWRLEGSAGATAMEGEVDSMTAYSATGSLFATRAARRDAEARLARDLGRRVTTALLAEFAARPGAA